MSNYRVLRGLSSGDQYFPGGAIINTSSFKNVDDLISLVASLESLAKEGVLEPTEEQATYLQADTPFVLDEAPEMPPASEPSAAESTPEPKKGKK